MSDLSKDLGTTGNLTPTGYEGKDPEGLRASGSASSSVIQKMEILNSLCFLEIDNEKIAEKLYTLVSEATLSESDVIQYLVQNKLHYTLEHFCSIDIKYVGVKRRKLPPTSGSEWSSIELEYYNIVFIDVDYKDITKIVTLSNKASNFIENNKNLTPTTFNFTESEKVLDLLNTAVTEFQRHILLVLSNPSKESCVDNMFMCFMRSVLDEDFLIEGRYDMRLIVSNTEKKATADIVAILFPQFCIGVIVVEDKPQETSKTRNQQENTEAQLVAEAIAIAQQERWNKGMPIFMVRVMDVCVSVYKVVFTNEFINSVKNGIKRNTPLKILRYSPKNPIFEGLRPGRNLLNPNDRELLVKILYSISQEIIQKARVSLPKTL